jgi:hypothetical protein
MTEEITESSVPKTFISTTDKLFSLGIREESNLEALSQDSPRKSFLSLPSNIV